MMLVEVFPVGSPGQTSLDDRQIVDIDGSSVRVEMRRPPHPIHGKRKSLQRQHEQDNAGDDSLGRGGHQAIVWAATVGRITSMSVLELASRSIRPHLTFMREVQLMLVQSPELAEVYVGIRLGRTRRSPPY